MGQLQHLIRCFLALDVLRFFFFERTIPGQKIIQEHQNRKSFQKNRNITWWTIHFSGHKLNNKNVKNLYPTHFKVFTLYWMQSTVSRYVRKDHHVDTGTCIFPNSGCQKDYTLSSLLIPWDKFIKYLILKWWCLHCHPHLWLMI